MSMEILTKYDDCVGKFVVNCQKLYRAYFKDDAKFSNRSFKTYTQAKEYRDRVIQRRKQLVLAAAGY